MITQRVDPADPLLGFVPRWVVGLAARMETLHVLSLDRAVGPLPVNVIAHSMGKGQRGGRARMAAQFLRVVAGLIGQVDAIFAHMVPRYAWLAAPLAARRHIPITLWYTHRTASRELRLALAVSRRVFTASPESFPLKSDKVRVLGHGIDSDFYRPPAPYTPDSPPVIVHVARLMPIKGQATLIRALAGVPTARAVFVGGLPDGADPAYAEGLVALARQVGVADRVTFTGALPPEGVRDWYGRATAAVNLSPAGLFDKAALEAMLCGLPTVVSNPDFWPVLGEAAPALLISRPDDVGGLAAQLRALLALPATARAEIGAGVRARTHAQHSLSGLMDRLAAEFTDLIRRKRP
jgi:glycosyltransferase involved in cell wall biosynthesis